MNTIQGITESPCLPTRAVVLAYVRQGLAQVVGIRASHRALGKTVMEPTRGIREQAFPAFDAEDAYPTAGGAVGSWGPFGVQCKE
jgi:hypothetical protein